MKDASRELIENGRPKLPAIQLLNICIERLCADSTHTTGDLVAPHLTYEELLGALVQARRELQENEHWRELEENA